MVDKIGYALFVIVVKVAVIAAVIVMILSGCSEPAQNPQESTTEQLLMINSELRQELQDLQIKQAYLEASYNSTQEAYNTLLGQVVNQPASTPAYPDYTQELASTKVAMQSLADKVATTEKLYLTTKQNEQKLKEKLDYITRAIEAVNEKTDETTTSNLTTEKRADFYELWNLWYKTVEW